MQHTESDAGFDGVLMGFDAEKIELLDMKSEPFSYLLPPLPDHATIGVPPLAEPELARLLLGV